MGFQILDKLSPHFRKQRCVGTVFNQKITDQMVPVVFAYNRLNGFESTGEQASDIAKHQTSVNGQTPVFDIRWWWINRRIT